MITTKGCKTNTPIYDEVLDTRLYNDFDIIKFNEIWDNIESTYIYSGLDINGLIVYGTIGELYRHKPHDFKLPICGLLIPDECYKI